MNVTRCLNHLVCSSAFKLNANFIFNFLLYVSICFWLNVMLWYIADMRRDVQEIFKMTPHDKQVMMFSATLSKEIRPVCKKFMQDVMSHGQNSLNFEVHLFY